jgi:hypothetical protein
MSENGVYPNMTIFMESMMNTSGPGYPNGGSDFLGDWKKTI